MNNKAEEAMNKSIYPRENLRSALKTKNGDEDAIVLLLDTVQRNAYMMGRLSVQNEIIDVLGLKQKFAPYG